MRLNRATFCCQNHVNHVGVVEVLRLNIVLSVLLLLAASIPGSGVIRVAMPLQWLEWV